MKWDSVKDDYRKFLEPLTVSKICDDCKKNEPKVFHLTGTGYRFSCWECYYGENDLEKPNEVGNNGDTPEQVSAP